MYHVPKHPELQLQGWEGELVENVVNFKGTKISANLPYKVQFVKPQEGAKDLKFVTHLVRCCWHALLCACDMSSDDRALRAESRRDGEALTQHRIGERRECSRSVAQRSAACVFCGAGLQPT